MIILPTQAIRLPIDTHDHDSTEPFTEKRHNDVYLLWDTLNSRNKDDLTPAKKRDASLYHARRLGLVDPIAGSAREVEAGRASVVQSAAALEIRCGSLEESVVACDSPSVETLQVNACSLLASSIRQRSEM